MSRFTDWIVEKLNPAQTRIAQEAGTQIGSQAKITYRQSFQKLEAVNRSVSMLVNAAGSLDYDVKDKVAEGVVTGIRQKSLNTLLNFRPNPYQSIQEFRQAIFTDLILEGNVFVHFDGVFMYHLPAASTEILTDTKTFIRGYRYNGMVDFKEAEVFHFRDLNSQSIYRGASRLEAAQRSIATLYAMKDFQENFFENGAAINPTIGGLIKEYNDTIREMMKLGKEELLTELGLEKKGDFQYETKDVSRLVRILRREAESRDLPDNMINAINYIINDIISVKCD